MTMMLEELESKCYRKSNKAPRNAMISKSILPYPFKGEQYAYYIFQSVQLNVFLRKEPIKDCW
jgi:hypothetical protein